MAIAVATDGQWEALSDVLGAPAWATDPALTEIAALEANGVIGSAPA